MYKYKIEMSYETDDLEDGIGWITEFVTHNEKYTKEEYEKICKNALKDSLEKYNEATMYTLKKILKDNYGFKQLAFESSFSFEEKVR